MTRATVLVVDDDEALAGTLRDSLEEMGHEVVTATSAEEALAVLARRPIDLVLSDIHMGDLSGVDLCAKVKGDPALQFIPVVLLTGEATRPTRLAGVRAGADDFFSKPYDLLELRTRVAALLRTKALLDETQQLHATIRAQAAQLAEANRALAERVAEQAGELDRLGRLKRFFTPQLAERIVASTADDPVHMHRSLVAVVFVDLRGFTAFAETSEPEDIMAVLQEYHAEMGRLIVAHEGALERYSGDGMMILFNDPVPVPEPAERALQMALAMRQRQLELTERWQRHGISLNFGIGMAYGYATLGLIGFEGRWDYTAIGTVVNLAARLCGAARPGEIVLSDRLLASVRTPVNALPLGDLALKGFRNPVRAFSLVLGA